MRNGSVVRGCALAALCAVLTAAGHVAGGGTVGDLTLLVVLLPLLAAGFTSAAGTCRSLAGTTAVLGAGQVVLHQTMVLLHPPHVGAAVSGRNMLVMHAAVTVVTALALRHADLAVSALLAGLQRVFPRRLTPPPVVEVRRACGRPVPPSFRLHAAVLAASVLRRGPPVRC